MPPGSAIDSESRGNVDAVAEDIVSLHNHVTEIEADAVNQDPRRRHVTVAPRHALLKVHRARSASVTLWNSTSMPSPVVLMMRPLHLAIAGSITSRRIVFSRAEESPLHRPP